MQISDQEWSLAKWGVGTFTTVFLFLIRLVCGNHAKVQEKQNDRLDKIEETIKQIEITLAKISTKLEINND